MPASRPMPASVARMGTATATLAALMSAKTRPLAVGAKYRRDGVGLGVGEQYPIGLAGRKYRCSPCPAYIVCRPACSVCNPLLVRATARPQPMPVPFGLRRHQGRSCARPTYDGVARNTPRETLDR